MSVSIRHQRLSGSKGLSTISASTINFGAILVGLFLIVWATSGNDEIAILNLWSAWGLFLGLFGQIGLISGVLDGTHWRSGRVFGHAALYLTLGAAGAAALRDRLFPEHGNWWVAVGIVALSTYLIGRRRSELTRQNRGSVALWIAAAENVARAVLLGIAFLIGGANVAFGADLAVVAIVAPFALSIVLLNRVDDPDLSATETGTEAASTAAMLVGVLAGVPALLAFGVVPALSVLERTDRLDLLAIAVMVARAPLVLGGFISPLILETDRTVGARTRWSISGVAGVAVLIQVLWLVTTNTNEIVNLAVLAVAAAASAGAGYVLVLASAPSINNASAPGVAITGAAVAFFAVLLAVPDSDGASALLALGVACSFVGFVVALDGRAGSDAIVEIVRSPDSDTALGQAHPREVRPESQAA